MGVRRRFDEEFKRGSVGLAARGYYVMRRWSMYSLQKLSQQLRACWFCFFSATLFMLCLIVEVTTLAKASAGQLIFDTIRMREQQSIVLEDKEFDALTRGDISETAVSERLNKIQHNCAKKNRIFLLYQGQ